MVTREAQRDIINWHRERDTMRLGATELTGFGRQGGLRLGATQLTGITKRGAMGLGATQLTGLKRQAQKNPPKRVGVMVRANRLVLGSID